MDTEVSRTLAELERKLHDLELALSSVGREQPEQTVPSQAASPAFASEQPQSGARVVDESVDLGAAGNQERASAQSDAGEQGEGHHHRPADESIELVELAQFRDRLQRTMLDLVEDYERIIRLRAASEQPRSATDER